MAAIDNPLKVLVDDFLLDFATWILNERIQSAHPLKTELPHPITADNVSQVTLADGRAVILHVEFQGPKSDPPIARRMLDYMVRLRAAHELPVASVVLYAGHRAGANDPGQHSMTTPVGIGSLHWEYQVLRLWELQAEDLLQLEQPALAALVGQARITQPEATFSEALRQIETVQDPVQQKLLARTLLALIESKELIAMVEKLVQQDNFLQDFPFAQLMQERGLEQGLEQGLSVLRRAILRTLTTRFTLTEAEQQAIEASLAAIKAPAQLEDVFGVALQAESLDAFQESLATHS